MLAVTLPQKLVPQLEIDTDTWEEACRTHGFEYIDSEAKGKNEYGGLLRAFLVCWLNEILRPHLPPF